MSTSSTSAPVIGQPATTAAAAAGAPAAPLPLPLTIANASDLIEKVPRVDIATANPPHQSTSTSSCVRRTRAKPYEFRCRHCHRTFAHHSRIIEHVRKHSPQLKLPCTLCDKTFTTDSTLNRHIRRHHQPQPLKQPLLPSLPPPSAPLIPVPVPDSIVATTTAAAAASAAAAAAASLPVPVSESASASSSAPAAACVPFDMVDVVQVYPPPGRQLSHVNSIVFTATVRRSDCLPHLNGQCVVYKSVNPAQNSHRSLSLLQHEFKMHETLREERFYVREAFVMLGSMMIMKHGGSQTLDEFMRNDTTRKQLQHNIQRAAYEIFSCIHACHKHQIVHRDLKPPNFVVKNATAEYFHLMIIDLGLACHIDDAANCARDTEFNHIKHRLRQAARETGVKPTFKLAELKPSQDTATKTSYNKPFVCPPCNVGTRGYRAPHLLRTHRCDYTDDLWVGALIVFEMATASNVYNLFQLSQPKEVSSDKQKMAVRVSEAVIQRRYVPWRLLQDSHPHLISFLRRVMREEQPYFNSAADIIDFIQDEDNDTVFQFHKLQPHNHNGNGNGNGYGHSTDTDEKQQVHKSHTSHPTDIQP